MRLPETMFRELTLSLILTVSAIVVGKFSSATTYVYHGINPIPDPLAISLLTTELQKKK
jgi:hypothetical protein